MFDIPSDMYNEPWVASQRTQQGTVTIKQWTMAPHLVYRASPENSHHPVNKIVSYFCRSYHDKIEFIHQSTVWLFALCDRLYLCDCICCVRLCLLCDCLLCNLTDFNWSSLIVYQFLGLIIILYILHVDELEGKPSLLFSLPIWSSANARLCTRDCASRCDCSVVWLSTERLYLLCDTVSIVCSCLLFDCPLARVLHGCGWCYVCKVKFTKFARCVGLIS